MAYTTKASGEGLRAPEEAQSIRALDVERDRQGSGMATERLVVFRDRSPAATAHLQIVPRRHIDNLNALQRCQEDHALVLEMLETGRQVLTRLHPGAKLRFGFHRPPFNSVLHLHMHGLALPYLEGAPKWKYLDWTPWWLPVESALKSLAPVDGRAAGPEAAAAHDGSPERS
ncbi:hypothetical protein ABPG77_010471 [Micractinium sp. CCAP 211/92]